MQFIQNGPDIPDALLQAHEEGRVVFFCGAGISYPAGLKDFNWLINEIYRLCGTEPTRMEKTAYKNVQFDTTLNLLEDRLPGGRPGLAMRKALANALKPRLRKSGATSTHAALLTLGACREGALRLVTTNFDRVFHSAAKRTGQRFQEHVAPMLPVPKNSRWNGLVYLHGLLPEKMDDTALNRLVVTSGDFGLAYLTERWAARFVSELFRNYVVCFVGYRINDPVLRYMMDALAADRTLGENTPQAWAFGDCQPGQEVAAAEEWEAKGVTPILYNSEDSHKVLHETLKAWAETYRDGVLGKEAIVVKHAVTKPSASTQQDNYVGRMLWAISDKSGLPAKRFADFNPAPSLEWLLEAFSDERFGHNDLGRFGVPPKTAADDKLAFSLTRRPSPYPLAPMMALVDAGARGSRWDDVMRHLANWLTRHLDDPALLLWLVKRGGQLHDDLIWWIEHRLDELAKLEREGKVAELERIRLNSPNAIPGQLMRTLWRLLLTGRVKSWLRDFDLYRWCDRFKRDGLTTTLRLELRETLTPRVSLREPFRWPDEKGESSEPRHIKELVEWEIVLSTDHVHTSLRDIPKDERWTAALPELLSDFSSLLRDALDLMRELGSAEDKSDLSYMYQPSISDHPQNQDFRDWTALIDLTRDAWMATAARSPELAALAAESWRHIPYPLFRRLAFFAAAQGNVIPHGRALGWLLADAHWWLWSAETEREAMRLLVALAPQLDAPMLAELEQSILAGPPRSMFKNDTEPERWTRIVDREIWLRLAKAAETGALLGTVGKERLDALSTQYPEWELEADQRNEFPYWTGDGGEWRKFVSTPRRRSELIEWLRQQPSTYHHWQEDDWRQRCRDNFATTACALFALAKENVWPTDRWREALQAWSEEGMVLRSWRYAAPLVQTMPDAVLQEIAHGVTWWMETASKSINRHENILVDLCGRVLALPLEAGTGMTRNGEPSDRPVTEAINQPVGHVTQALINLWFKRNPNDNDMLPTDIRPFFTTLCDVQVDRFRHGRVLMGSRLIAFFRVDRPWTEQHLLPLFNWNNPAEAKAVWEGFLWSPRLYQPLLTAFKSQFLETAIHYADLGEHRQQFVAFLTYAALGPTEEYAVEDFRSAIGRLPQEGLEESAQALSQALEGAADQREDYWRNRVQPFWQQVWPKSRNLATPRIAESLARLAIAARGEFPAAMAAVQDWLQPIEHPSYVVHLLHESDLCRRFPADALLLLNAVIDDQPWAPRELSQCLDDIMQAARVLEQDARYKRLREYSRRREI